MFRLARIVLARFCTLTAVLARRILHAVKPRPARHDPARLGQFDLLPNMCCRKGRYAMKPELIPITGRRPSTVMPSAKKTCRQWSPWAMAFAILLGLAAVPPSAQGQTFTVLHSFKGGTDGASPVGGVWRDAAGNLYGTAGSGGTFSTGAVFKVDTTGKETVLYGFTGRRGGTDGYARNGGVIADKAGNLYGTTAYGGPFNNGTVFKLDSTGKE